MFFCIYFFFILFSIFGFRGSEGFGKVVRDCLLFFFHVVFCRICRCFVFQMYILCFGGVGLFYVLGEFGELLSFFKSSSMLIDLAGFCVGFLTL